MSPPTVYSGKPSETAKNGINHFDAISELPLYTVDGTGSETTLHDILGKSNKGTSLVVFVRSLG